MPSSILVTGGAGYIGSHTVKLLTSLNEDVIVIDNLVFGHQEAIVSDQVKFIKGDVGDKDLLNRIFNENEIEAVIHFAAFAYVGESMDDPLKYYRNNTAEPIVLLDAMRDNDCKKFIFSSTCATYGTPDVVPITEQEIQKPINPYGMSKYMLERVLEDCDNAHGIKSVFLRYFNASGCDPSGEIGEDHEPETHLIPRILMAITGEIDELTVFGTDYPTPDGTCIRDYIHVMDLASAHVKALGYLRLGGETVPCNLGTGKGFSVKEIIDAAEEVTGKKVPVKYGERRAGDPAELIADPTRAKELLDWEAQHKDPKYHLETAWKWMSEKGGRY